MASSDFYSSMGDIRRDRMPHHNFMYTVGMLSETALAAATLIWEG